MRPVILVPGTHAWRGDGRVDWYNSAQFLAHLTAHGYEPLDPRRPFVWSTDLGGVPFRGLAVWKAAGLNLYAYAVPPRCPERRVPAAETVVISHSHGLQVALCAAAEGLKIDTLVDVCGPVRMDLRGTAGQARPNIRRWVHVHAGRRDRWQWFGTLFDGYLGVVREHPLADQNVAVPEADHGQVLRDPRYFHVVTDALEGA